MYSWYIGFDKCSINILDFFNETTTDYKPQTTNFPANALMRQPPNTPLSTYHLLTASNHNPFYLYPPMSKLILYGFLIYLLYKFVFELLVPVSKATTQVKDKLREMQEQQAAQQRAYQQQTQQTQQTQAPKETPVKGGDYIEFEEVK